LEFATYILTGGNSTRMGTDKALQIFRKQTFLQHILNALKPINTTIKLVSSKQSHQNLDFDYIVDIAKDKGPVSGIASALKDTKNKWNLILSCDIPLLQTNFIEWLIANHHSSFDATVCIVEDKKMPLTAIYNKSCLSLFSKHLKTNQLRVMSVIQDLNINYIKVPKDFRAQLTNVNTPEQLKAISL